MLNEGDLEQFTGTVNYFQHFTGIKYTDGVKYVAQSGSAYWLIDAIISHQTNPKVKAAPFQIWELTVNSKSGILTVKEDSSEPILVEQELPYTDFPLQHIKLYLIDKVLMLPSEY